MSTSNTSSTLPTLQQLRTHLLEIDPELRTQTQLPVELPAELLALEKLNTTLMSANDVLLNRSRSLFQALAQANLTEAAGKALLDQLKTLLNAHLQALDEASTLDGLPRKRYITETVGRMALEQQARLDVRDYLLSPAEQRMIEDCSRGPAFRPGMYALTFSYQDQAVEFAGAFVLTRDASPVVDNLTSGRGLGHVLLFTPNRGLEAFDSLAQLDASLKAVMASRAGREEFCRHLPVRYQALDVVGIWPLQLLPIDGESLFEHTYNAVLDKRRQDIDLALSLADNPMHDALQLQTALDTAVKAALPDLSLRLAFRRQQLLERSLYNSLPDWYRSATSASQETLSHFIDGYNQARQTYLDLLGPVASPQALASHQVTEYLDEELELHDLDVQHLQVTTRRNVTNVGVYEQQRSLAELSYYGLHTGDELPGSDFLTNTTLSYGGTALQGEHAELNAQDLLDMLREPDLQPRLDFATLQKDMQTRPAFKLAARDMFDRRLMLLAYVARLRGDLSEADYRLFEDLRAGTNPQLCAQTVLLHGAQLKDLWLLREEEAGGQTRRLLLCTPGSPREQQFIGFRSERECQAHIIGWADDNSRFNNRTMSDYLLEQCPLRFRTKMGTFLSGLGFKPDAQEHNEVTFGPLCTHTVCLDAIVVHAQSAAVDDYEYSTPLWYRSAPAADRIRLTSLAEDAAGGLRVYNARPDSEANFITFNAFLHDKAKLSLNTLLGRSQNDIDPDKVYVSAPWPLVGGMPAAISYTRLYRDGYKDNVGFIDPKFSTSATFSGPDGVDLSRLTAQNVARSVTGVWIGQHYADEVRNRLQSATSLGYTERRNATLAINQLQMKHSALECCLRGHIARFDLAWLECAIDSLGDTTVATRKTYKVHRLMLDGEWVIGNYLFSHADNPVLLYTPNAPDGIDWREARLFNYWLKKVDGVSEYLQGRVTVKAKVRIGHFLEAARKGLPDTISRTTPSPARHDPIADGPPLADLRHELYNMVLQRKIDDVVATTTNRTEMIMGILWTCVELVTAIATIPYPVLSLSLGGLLAFKDAMLAISAYQQGDTKGALQHFIGYMVNLGGALLFDFRPAFKGPFNTLSIRPLLKTAKQAALLKELDPRIPSDMKPVLFNGQERWVKNTPDANAYNLLYRFDPQNGQMLSTARLVKQDDKGLWVRAWDERWGGRKYQVLQEDVNPVAGYEISAEQGSYFRSVLDSDFVSHLSSPDDVLSEGSRGVFYDQLRGLRDSYSQSVKRLAEDADALYASPPARPTRTGLPVLASDSSPSTVLATLFPLKKGLIIGAPNASVTSKQLLIENMQALAAKGLKRLYIENLPADVFRTKLKIINGEAKGKLAYAMKRVEDHLARVDQALGLGGADASFTYRKLMLEAHKHKVAIEGVDASSSYQMVGVLELRDGERLIPRSSKLRNFYSHKALAAKDPDEGWIALVNHDRIGSSDELPGLADLQNVVALRVDDVAPGQAVGIVPDTSAAALSRGDYKLTMAPAVQTVPRPGPSSVVQVPTTPSHYSVFDLPATYRNNLEEMVLTPSEFNTSRSHISADRPYAEAFKAFESTRDRLKKTATEAFAAYTPPARSNFTDLGTATTEEAFIKQVFEQKLGLIIAEAHGDKSSKQLLIKYMKLMKELDVKTLYVEHLLTDVHQAQLDIWHNAQIKAELPKNLKRYLKAQDRGHMPGYSGDDTYTRVISIANKYGIRVRALDCTASYHVKGMRELNARQTLFSYFANEVIKADQAALGPHRWVAFMGDSHADMFHGVPGLAQLQDAVSLTVRDVAPSRAQPLHRGSWEIIDGDRASVNGLAKRSDFKVDVGIAGTPSPRATALPDHAWLRNVDDFVIERPSATQANVVHRTELGAIASTPIKIDEGGLFYMQGWAGLNDKRFLRLENLRDALKEDLYMSPVSAAAMPSARLKKPGDFFIERPTFLSPHVVHYSRSGEIISTPIEGVGQVGFSIGRWPQLIGKKYSTVEHLIDALKTEVGLSAVADKALPQARLRLTGEFLIERQTSTTQANVLHRSNSGEILSTPIQTDASGHFYMDRWPQVQGERYSSMDDLIRALKSDVGLIPAS